MTSPVTDSPPPVSVPKMTEKHIEEFEELMADLDFRGARYPQRRAVRDAATILKLLASGDYKLIRTEEIKRVENYAKEMERLSLDLLTASQFKAIQTELHRWSITEGAR